MAYLRHFWYLVQHKYWVFVAGRVMGVSLWQLIIHDWSKFMPDEWTPYAEFFHKDLDGEEERAIKKFGSRENVPYGYLTEDRFNVAWLLHQRRNPHHWQFWFLIDNNGDEIILPIPDRYLREMVADWAGAGKAHTGKWVIVDWYTKNRNNTKLHPITRKQLEKYLTEYWGYKR